MSHILHTISDFLKDKWELLLSSGLRVMIIAAIIPATILIVFIIKLIFKNLIKRLEQTPRIWDDVLLRVTYRPLKALIWLFSITIIMQLIRIKPYYKLYQTSITNIAETMQRVGIVIIIIWVSISFVREIKNRFLDPKYVKQINYDQTTIDALSKLFQLIILFAGTLMILTQFGVRISAILAFGGGATIVAGLGAKDVLSNLFGGLTIYLDRPFSVGDKIFSPDRNIEGTVEKIGWRLTRIRTPDKKPLYVPNSVFSTLAIQNSSRMTNRRIKTDIGIRYCDAGKIPLIVNDIEDMLRNHPEIDTRAELSVRFTGFGASALNISLNTFTKTTKKEKYLAVQEDIFLKIFDIVHHKHQAQMAFTTYTVEINKT